MVLVFSVFFFNDTATTEIYTLSLHDALPIWPLPHQPPQLQLRQRAEHVRRAGLGRRDERVHVRSEEHTSEFQSPCNLVCRLLLEKKKKRTHCDQQGHRQILLAL